MYVITILISLLLFPQCILSFTHGVCTRGYGVPDGIDCVGMLNALRRSAGTPEQRGMSEGWGPAGSGTQHKACGRQWSQGTLLPFMAWRSQTDDMGSVQTVAS